MSENTWGEWLSNALEERGWTQAEFVRQSEGHIKADRVSKWLRSKETASHRFAVIAANTLGKPHSEALRAAGFTDAADGIERRRDKLNKHLGLDRPSQGQLIEALKNVPDSELLRILQIRAEYRESGAPSAVGVAQGNHAALNVPGMGDNDLHEIDLSQGDVELAATTDTSATQEQAHPEED